VNSEFQYVQLRQHQEVRAGDEVGRRQLEQVADPLLDPDYVEAVLECLRGVAVGDASGDLVEAEEAEPDGHLQAQVGPASGQMSASGCDECGHRTCSRAGMRILTRG
jgi:hypothetical protein